MNKKEIFKQILKKDFEFSGDVQIDSRLLKKGDIFFAIGNGNDYVKDAINIGAFPIYEKNKYNCGLKVNDSVEFLQKFAKKYRQQLNSTVIGITGSNGKTSVKDMLASMLDNSYKTQGNYNNHIGLPLTILNCPIDAKYLVLELGTSRPGEIAFLAKIAKPDYSIITNVGTSHLAYFESQYALLKEKASIRKYTKNETIVSDFDPHLRDLRKVIRLTAYNVVVDDTGTSFRYNDKIYKINLYGWHYAENMVLVLKLLDILNENIDTNKMLNLKISKMRFEIIRKNEKIYINDAYNASPRSMRASLDTLDNIFLDKEKILVLGDMLELGPDEIEQHKRLEYILSKIKYSKVFLVGKRMRFVEARNSIKTYDKEYVKREIDKMSNCVVFLKGSRGMKLEEIIGGDN